MEFIDHEYLDNRVIESNLVDVAACSGYVLQQFYLKMQFEIPIYFLASVLLDKGNNS